MDNTIHITLMRHGRSLADDEMVHEGRYDSPLTDVGRAQVRSRAEEWKRSGVTFDLIFASTLVRASESAQIVGETLDVPIEHDPDWMELDNGPLAGLPFDVGNERYPKPDFSNPFQPYIVATGDGESSWDIDESRRERPATRDQKRTAIVPGGGPRRHPQRRHVLHTGRPAPPRGPRSSGVHFNFGDACFVRTFITRVGTSGRSGRWLRRRTSCATLLAQETVSSTLATGNVHRSPSHSAEATVVYGAFLRSKQW